MSQFSLAQPSVNRSLPFGPDRPVIRLTEKYRPATLADVLGQGAVVHQLQAFIEAPYPTAFIFEGETGIGKTSCAVSLANDMGMNPDWDMDEIKSGQANEEEVTRAIKRLRQCGINGGWRMLIVNEADAMSVKARLMFLDILEELPARSVVIFTTNHATKFEARFRDRCDVVSFASDCGLLMQDAQSLVNRIWLGETGQHDAPDARTLPNLCQDGAMSFRRVVNAVASALQARPAPSLPEPESTPDPVFEAPEWAESPSTPSESFPDPEPAEVLATVPDDWKSVNLSANPDPSYPGVAYDRHREGWFNAPGHILVSFKAMDSYYRQGYVKLPEPAPIAGGSPEAVEAPAKPRSADQIIRGAIDDYRAWNGIAFVWERLAESERTSVNRRLVALGCRKIRTGETGSDRFHNFIRLCCNGNVIASDGPRPAPESTPDQPAPSADPGPIAAPVASQAPCVEAPTPAPDFPQIDPERQARIDAWKERKAARVERLRERAETAQARSDAAYQRSNAIADRIPFGQPILVGHHSERGHRADIKRIHNAMDKACEESAKAKHYERAADAAESNDAIDSRDPEAIDLLREKLAERQALQARMKAVNDAHKRFLKDPATLDASDLPEAYKARIRDYKPAYSWEPHPFAPYQLSNNNKEIRRIEGRIAEVEKRQATEARPDVEIDGVTISEDAEYDTVQLFYPGKPDEATRSRLKANGFRWARSVGAWTRRRSNRTEWILGTLFPGYAEAIKGGATPTPEPPPVSGGAPLVEPDPRPIFPDTVDALVAERKALVAEVVGAIRECLRPRDERIDRLVFMVKEHVVDAVRSLRTEGHANPYWPWSCMGQGSRADFLTFLDLMGDVPTPDDDGETDPYSRWVRFIELCVTGSPVTFPESTPPDDWGSRPTSLVINGTLYTVAIGADGIELAKPDGSTIIVIDGPSGPECSCSDYHFRKADKPGQLCKHGAKCIEAGLLPPLPIFPDEAPDAATGDLPEDLRHDPGVLAERPQPPRPLDALHARRRGRVDADPGDVEVGLVVVAQAGGRHQDQGLPEARGRSPQLPRRGGLNPPPAISPEEPPMPDRSAEAILVEAIDAYRDVFDRREEYPKGEPYLIAQDEAVGEVWNDTSEAERESLRLMMDAHGYKPDYPCGLARRFRHTVAQKAHRKADKVFDPAPPPLPPTPVCACCAHPYYEGVNDDDALSPCRRCGRAVCHRCTHEGSICFDCLRKAPVPCFSPEGAMPEPERCPNCKDAIDCQNGRRTCDRCGKAGCNSCVRDVLCWDCQEDAHDPPMSAPDAAFRDALMAFGLAPIRGGAPEDPSTAMAQAYRDASQAIEAPRLAGDRGRDLYTAEDFGEPGREARRLAALAIHHKGRALGLDDDPPPLSGGSPEAEACPKCGGTTIAMDVRADASSPIRGSLRCCSRCDWTDRDARSRLPQAGSPEAEPADTLLDDLERLSESMAFAYTDAALAMKEAREEIIKDREEIRRLRAEVARLETALEDMGEALHGEDI